MASRTIYLDVSEVLARKLHTGIQRVVRQVARASIAIGTETGRRVIPVVAVGSRIHALNQVGMAALVNPPAKTYSVALPTDTPGKKLLRDVLRGIPPVYNTLQKRYVANKLSGLHVAEAIQLGSDDCYVLLDSFWGGSSSVDAAVAAHRAGCSVVPVVYDLIPISHPGFCDAQNVRAFKRDIAILTRVATGLVTISRYCVFQIEDFLGQQRMQLPVAHFYLGADLDITNSADERSDLEWHVEIVREAGPIYLMVGTIEPRKGHEFVLDGFDRLWAQGRDEKLLIVGKIGWAREAFMARCAAHPELGKRLFLIHDATDAKLSHAYSFSTGAIIASTIEGFGLPLVEAMHKGLPVIASDIPVFREIGTDAVVYFKLDDAIDLANAVAEMSDNSSIYRAAASRFEWINWQESAQQFLTSVDGVIARHRQTQGTGNAVEAVKAG